jgi:hypothetical protein
MERGWSLILLAIVFISVIIGTYFYISIQPDQAQPLNPDSILSFKEHFENILQEQVEPKYRSSIKELNEFKVDS